jgi:hypothetical protein
MNPDDRKAHSCRVLLGQLGRSLEVSGFDADEVLRVSKGLADVATSSTTQIMNYIDARDSSQPTSALRYTILPFGRTWMQSVESI